MPEPIKYHYDTSRDLPEVKAEESMPKAPIIGDDPLNSFERYDWKANTDLGAWMTYSPEAREEKVKRYAADKKNMDRRHKNLVYIIWYESAHPAGSSTVAARAFRALFPNHLKDQKADAS